MGFVPTFFSSMHYWFVILHPVFMELGRQRPFERWRIMETSSNWQKCLARIAVQKRLLKLWRRLQCACTMVMMGKTSIISDWGTFKQKVAKSSKYVEAKSLPPTRAATKFHRLRAYFKIREWKGGNQLKPVEWGWKLSDGKLQPIKTDLPAGPVNLLAIIRCNCTSGCTTARCSCRKHGLHCSGLCGDCKGLHCTNSPQLDLDDDEVTFD